MSLEQTLTEIEPIFRSSNGTFQFTHPSFREVLTAKQFADEINSGALSVRDAYVNFWSYEEDAELWDLPRDREWRALLPGWNNVLLDIVPMLNTGRTKELVDVVSASYLNAEEKLPEKNYNPFLDAFFFAIKLIRQSKKGERLESKQLIDHLVTKWDFFHDVFIYQFHKDSCRGEKGFHKDIGRALTVLGLYDVIDSLCQRLLSASFTLVNVPRLVIDVGGERAIPYLVGYIENRGYPEDDIALSALAGIKAEIAVPLLFQCIQSENDKLHKMSYIETLAKIRCEQAVPFLLEYIRDKSNPYRVNAIRNLEMIIGDEALPFLMEYIRDENNPQQIEAIQTLGEIKGEEAVPFLLEYVANKSNPYRLSAIEALTGIRCELALPLLIQYIQDREDPDLYCALSDLGYIGGENDVPFLLQYLKDENSLNRDGAICALGKIGSKEAVPFLVQYIKNKNNPHTDSAIFALGDIGGEEVVSFLMQYLREKENPHRYMAIRALVKMKVEQVFPSLLQCLIDENNPDRKHAIYDIAEIENRKTIKHLKSLWQDGDIGSGAAYHADSFSTVYNIIYSIHQRLKPRGYNPPAKRLVS